MTEEETVNTELINTVQCPTCHNIGPFGQPCEFCYNPRRKLSGIYNKMRGGN